MKNSILLLALLFISSIQAQQIATKKLPPKYTQTLFQHENIFIGAQPDYIDFADIKEFGITKVINNRTLGEMKELNFYEDYLLKKAGIEYVFIPIGDEGNEYSPEKLKEFAQAIDSADGKVLLHCRSGHRASQMWAAYLVQYQGKTPDEALEMVSDMGWWPMPMEALLNKKLSVQFAEEK
ncbi:MAG: sulfur transferase domain-containing protein [Gammaproteobacteria bacterium]|jgi:uncharacterized protein (TIGR01244 family)|nr:dual specificity protein phosphatase family protein [Xanthomonadales bacterium]